MIMRSMVTGCALASMLGLTQGANAEVTSFAIGSDLAGSTITITWQSVASGQSLGETSAVIQVGNPGQSIAEIADPFGGTDSATFTITGDTFLENWALINNTNAVIASVHFDLGGSAAVFDDDSNPSTDGSALGFDGIEYQAGSSTAPQHTSAEELVEWVDPQNTGDLFTQQRIEWNTTPGIDTFDPGEIFVWRDDVDLVPSPGSMALLCLTGVFMQRRRTR